MAPRGGDTTYTETRTVGLGGLMFQGETRLSEGSKYNYRLIFQERTLEFIGKVVYIIETDDDLYQTGIEFIDISSEDKDFLLASHLRMNYDIGMEQP